MDPFFRKLCPKVYILRSTSKLIFTLLVKTQSISNYHFDVINFYYAFDIYFNKIHNSFLWSRIFTNLISLRSP